MPEPSNSQSLTRSQRAFKSARTEVRALVRDVLVEERRVRHMKRRDDIFSKILQLVRTSAR